MVAHGQIRRNGLGPTQRVGLHSCCGVSVIFPLVLICALGQVPDEPETQPELRHAIWQQPVPTFFYQFRNQPTLFLELPVVYSLGGQFGLNRFLSATSDITIIPLASTSNDNLSSPAWLATGSLGILISVWGPEQTKGFFVQPRGAFSAGHAWGRRCSSNCPSPRGTIQLLEAMFIVDVGFQWRFFRRLYVAAVIGAGAGSCVGCGGDNAHLTVTNGILGRAGVSRFSWGLDLNVLRIGVAL